MTLQTSVSGLDRSAGIDFADMLFSKHTQDVIEASPSRFWQKMYTRSIKSPASFITWKRVAQEWCLHLIAAADHGAALTDRGASVSYAIWETFEQIPARPVFFVKTEFAEAMVQTSREEVQIADLHTPRMAINIFMVHALRPSILKTGQPTGVKTPKGREEWTANIIGGDFKIRYEPRAGEPTGITRRAHWVSGHLRNQACGPQHKERKMIWIEPYMTGLAPEGAKEKENG